MLMFWHHVRPIYLVYFYWLVFNGRTNELKNPEKLVIFDATLRLSLEGYSMKALIHYYGDRFIFIMHIIRVACCGNEP